MRFEKFKRIVEYNRENEVVNDGVHMSFCEIRLAAVIRKTFATLD